MSSFIFKITLPAMHENNVRPCVAVWKNTAENGRVDRADSYLFSPDRLLDLCTFVLRAQFWIYARAIYTQDTDVTDTYSYSEFFCQIIRRLRRDSCSSSSSTLFDIFFASATTVFTNEILECTCGCGWLCRTKSKILIRDNGKKVVRRMRGASEKLLTRRGHELAVCMSVIHLSCRACQNVCESFMLFDFCRSGRRQKSRRKNLLVNVRRTWK